MEEKLNSSIEEDVDILKKKMDDTKSIVSAFMMYADETTQLNKTMITKSSEIMGNIGKNVYERLNIIIYLQLVIIFLLGIIYIKWYIIILWGE